MDSNRPTPLTQEGQIVLVRAGAMVPATAHRRGQADLDIRDHRLSKPVQSPETASCRTVSPTVDPSRDHRGPTTQHSPIQRLVAAAQAPQPGKSLQPFAKWLFYIATAAAIAPIWSLAGEPTSCHHARAVIVTLAQHRAGDPAGHRPSTARRRPQRDSCQDRCALNGC